MANTPDFLTSFVATSARLLINLEHTFCLSSNLSANAFAILPFVIARAVAWLVGFWQHCKMEIKNAPVTVLTR